MSGWTFCQFLRSYRTPAFYNMLYVVNDLVPHDTLKARLALPHSLACHELYAGLYDARLWMSGGNTTSSLHFDTHDNVLLQIDGAKEVLLWHPNASAELYMDHFPKFGLSPINVDRVDLERFPALTHATPPLRALLQPGDALYLPNGWWHVITSTGRNVAVALEIEPFATSGLDLWPSEMRAAQNTPGLYWATQQRINQAMREQLAERIPSRATRQPIRCDTALDEMPSSLGACSWLGQAPVYL